jgi:hypothetical protein
VLLAAPLRKLRPTHGGIVSSFHLELRTPADRTALVLYFSYELAARTGGEESPVYLVEEQDRAAEVSLAFLGGLQDDFRLMA